MFGSNDPFLIPARTLRPPERQCVVPETFAKVSNVSSRNGKSFFPQIPESSMMFNSLAPERGRWPGMCAWSTPWNYPQTLLTRQKGNILLDRAPTRFPIVQPELSHRRICTAGVSNFLDARAPGVSRIEKYKRYPYPVSGSPAGRFRARMEVR